MTYLKIKKNKKKFLENYAKIFQVLCKLFNSQLITLYTIYNNVEPGIYYKFSQNDSEILKR